MNVVCWYDAKQRRYELLFEDWRKDYKFFIYDYDIRKHDNLTEIINSCTDFMNIDKLDKKNISDVNLIIDILQSMKIPVSEKQKKPKNVLPVTKIDKLNRIENNDDHNIVIDQEVGEKMGRRRPNLGQRRVELDF